MGLFWQKRGDLSHPKDVGAFGVVKLLLDVWGLVIGFSMPSKGLEPLNIF